MRFFLDRAIFSAKQVKAMPKNPDWTTEETLLALDLYIRSGMRLLGKTHPDVIELSDTLKRLRFFKSNHLSDTLRNPAGVAMKLANIKAAHTSSGLDHGSKKLEKDLWTRYAHAPDLLRSVANQLRSSPANPAPDTQQTLFSAPSTRGSTRTQQYWALCANPKIYRIADAVSEMEIDHWRTSDRDLRAGDHAIIWQTRDRLGRRGIIAFAKILADPIQMADELNPYWVDGAPQSDVAARVPVHYYTSDALPLWQNDSRATALLESLSVSRARGGSIFRVESAQWAQLTKLSGLQPPSDAEIEVIRYTRLGNGQGFGLNARERTAVENHAMELAESYYRKEWNVRDVHSNHSYDLHCSRDDEQLRVEVKGTTGGAEHVVLTRNEVTLSRLPGYSLFVVAHIELDRNDSERPVARGGECFVFDPWSADPTALEPLTYRCNLDLRSASPVDVALCSGLKRSL
jgi:hypothetical protein